MSSTDELLQQAVLEFARGQIAANARIDALAQGLAVLAKRTGMGDAEFVKMMTELDAGALARRLEKLETANPSLSAELDQRPLPPEVDPDAHPRHP